MKQPLSDIAVAKKYPLLYVYAAINVLIELAYLPFYLHSPPYPTANRSNGLSHQQLAITGVVVLAIYGVVFGYLVLSKNTQKVILILKIILGLQLVGLLLGLLRLSYLILVSVVGAGFTFAVLQKVQNKKHTTLF